MDNSITSLPVVIIGGSPIGLAAVAQLLERGIEPLLLEPDPEVAGNLRRHGDIRLLSPWRHNFDRAASRLLQRHGWIEPDPEQLPTADDLVRQYLEPLAALPEISTRLRLGARVLLISPTGFAKVKSTGRECRPFVIRYETEGGQTEEVRARAIIDASGAWPSPNPPGGNGFPTRDGAVDLCTAGTRSHERAATFVIADGYEHVRSIAAALAGDFGRRNRCTAKPNAPTASEQPATACRG